MKTFNSGSISVFGSENSDKVSHRIGFMPQNVELVPKLTVAETLSFFGNIYHMKKRKLRNRLEMLSNLLEINFPDSQMMNLSGGQKRRVALAVALIHEPELLILDEPTVGLDVILRAKIWDFLKTSTENHQMSVLVTTHYITEAQFAHRVGFIRNGVILAENSPSRIVESLEVETLDDAFVELCQRDEENLASNLFFDGEDVSEGFQEFEFESFSKRKSFAFQTFSALFTKEFQRFRRTPM
jgi:ABC-type multidrug transport system ATPase subunit